MLMVLVGVIPCRDWVIKTNPFLIPFPWQCNSVSSLSACLFVVINTLATFATNIELSNLSTVPPIVTKVTLAADANIHATVCVVDLLPTLLRMRVVMTSTMYRHYHHHGHCQRWHHHLVLSSSHSVRRSRIVSANGAQRCHVLRCVHMT